MATCSSQILIFFFSRFQHASADVEKMVLGNKCDINDKRQVSKDRGEKVRRLVEVKISCHWFIFHNRKYHWYVDTHVPEEDSFLR